MKGGQGRKSLEIKDFSGGLVTKSAPKDLDTKYSVDCLNVYAEGKTLRERSGVTVVNPTSATGAGNGVYNWVKSSSSQWLLMLWGTALTKMDVVTGVWDGSVDTVVASTADGTAFTGGFMDFVTYGNILVMTTDARDKPQVMTTSDTSYHNLATGGSGTAPQAKYCQVWKSHVWLLNTSSDEDIVFNSAVNTYNSWGSADSASYSLITPGDIGVTGSFIHFGRMYVTKKWSIHRFTYTGNVSPLVEIRETKSTIGTSSPRSIKNVNIPSKGESVIFLGSDRNIYVFDGIDATPVADSISVTNGLATVYTANINTGNIGKCFAIVDERIGQYEVFFSVGTSTVLSNSIIYDYLSGALWPTDARPYSAGDVADDGSFGNKRVYVQDASSGKLYLFNQGNSDNTVAINSFWTSPKVGKSSMLSKFDEIEVETYSVASCNPTFSWRADWESSWVNNTMGASTNSHIWNPGRVDNLIQFKIAHNTTTAGFKLWAINLGERLLGGGK